MSAEEEESKTSDQISKGHKNTKANNGTKNNRENSGDTNSKEKLDYIHVRARRGQATDSHSLAERVSTTKSIRHLFGWLFSMFFFLFSFFEFQCRRCVRFFAG